MKKNLRTFLLTAFLLLTGYFIYQIINRIKIRKQAAENIGTMPQFSFSTIQHQVFSKQNLDDTSGNVIIQLFSPDCEHCQYMAKSFVKNKEKLKDIEIIMVTPFGDSSSVAEFEQTSRLNTLTNVHFLLDARGAFFKVFGSSSVPSFYLYKNNRLVKSIEGETKIENLFY